ncbi:hypothetical protein AB76_5651, partial [Escherichia coli 3-267-03_S1_C3]
MSVQCDNQLFCFPLVISRKNASSSGFSSPDFFILRKTSLTAVFVSFFET